MELCAEIRRKRCLVILLRSASSGSSFYSPSNIKLNEKVKFYIKNGHIQSVIGNEKDVCNIKRHYDYVSNKFEIKRDIVHSLHCGIHNGLLSESIKLNNPDKYKEHSKLLTHHQKIGVLYYHDLQKKIPQKIMKLGKIKILIFCIILKNF